MSARREAVGDGVERVVLRGWASALSGYDVSVWLVDGVLVDTGFPGARDDVVRLAYERRPRAAFVTHWHEDHAGNVDALAQLRVPVDMLPDTERYVRAPERLPMYRRHTWGQPRGFTREIDRVDVARVAPGWQAIATPGHTADHRVLWNADRRLLFSGDLFLGVKVRIAHHEERPRELVASLRAMASLEPRRMFCAHRGAVEQPAEVLRAKAEWTMETVGRIEALHARGWSTRAIAREVLGRETVTGWISRGEYSARAWVEAALAEAR